MSKPLTLSPTMIEALNLIAADWTQVPHFIDLGGRRHSYPRLNSTICALEKSGAIEFRKNTHPAEWRRVVPGQAPNLPAPRRRRIYVASSWRNTDQPDVVFALRADGHEVYDFRHPAPGNTGFAWSQIDPDWMAWTPERFAELLAKHPVAAAGFDHDKQALDRCDTCVLVLPCGRSAHLELGYAAGQRKDTFVLLHPDKFEPELMYLLNTQCVTSLDQLLPLLDGRAAVAALGGPDADMQEDAAE